MARRPVIFDCDGVLVDSETLSWQAWRATAARTGIEISDEFEHDHTGRSARDIYAALATPNSWPPDRFHRELDQATATLFEQDLEPFDDAEDAVDHLHRIGYPMAVASSSTQQRLELSLRVTRLDRYFSHAVGSDGVDAAKPAPDLYLAAASALGVDPTACLAVEDTPSGIASARAAGMTVVAVDRGLFDVEALSGANLVVPRLTPAALM